jgi:hypothetical protein
MTIRAPGYLRSLAGLPVFLALAMAAWGGVGAAGRVLVVDGRPDGLPPSAGVVAPDGVTRYTTPTGSPLHTVDARRAETPMIELPPPSDRDRVSRFGDELARAARAMGYLA